MLIVSVILPFIRQSSYDDAQKAADFILTKTSCRPEIGIICGSGLGSLADVVEECTAILYSTIPHFPVSTGKKKICRHYYHLYIIIYVIFIPLDLSFSPAFSYYDSGVFV